MPDSRSTRVVLEQDVRVIDTSADGVRLEGRARLSPGQRVRLVDRSGAAGLATPRRAVVQSWIVTRLSGKGPIYQGICRFE